VLIRRVVAAAAATTKCVALVVDFTTTGGGVMSSCVTVPSDASGSDVLVSGHHKVTFDPRYGNDFVCAIDGVPASGCRGVDDTHFWAYYHRSPGGSSWQISQEGAGTYQPKNASTEGWIYNDGQSSAPQPRNVPYASICPKQASPPPSPRPSKTAATRVTTTSTPAPRVTSRTEAPEIPPVAARTKPKLASKPTVTASASTATTASSETSPAATVVSRAASARRSSGGVPVGAVIGAVGVVALGAAAFVRSRRNRT
jgi:hypothetical protein